MDTRQIAGDALKKSGYSYRRTAPRLLAAAFDAIGPVFLTRQKTGARPAGFSHIVVIRVDQIGDIVLAIPFLQALRTHYPKSRITLITSAAGQALLQSVAGLCETRIFEAPWFKGERGILQAMRDLRALLKALAPDAVVDLRGDVRHLWSARQSLPQSWIEGYGITGGGFLADFVQDHPVFRHAALRNFGFMGVEPPAVPLTIDPALASQPLNRRVRDLLPQKNSPWIAFHIGAGADAKRWPETYWKQLAERVARETDARILWIGDRDADDRARIVISLLAPPDRQRSIVLCHLVGLGELGTLFKQCDLLVTGDSGPAHVAAASATPTLVLFSGANDPMEWRPLNVRAQILDHTVPCSPCGLKACNQPTHACMEGIGPDRVFEQILKALKST